MKSHRQPPAPSADSAAGPAVSRRPARAAVSTDLLIDTDAPMEPWLLDLITSMDIVRLAAEANAPVSLP